MAIIVFIILSCIFLYAGVLSIFSSQRSIVVFVALLAFAPISNPYHDFVTFNGVHSYDFYFAGIGLSLLLRSEYKVQRYAVIIAIIALAYLGVASLFHALDGRSFDKAFLLDLRPYIALFECILFAVLIRNVEDHLSINNLVVIVIFSSMFTVIWFVLLKRGMTGMEDSYYTEGYVRYFSAATYLSLGYLLAWSYGLFAGYRHKLLLNISIIAGIFTIFMSGYRVVIFTTLLIMIINFAIRGKITSVILGVAASFLLVGSFYLIYEALEVSRVSGVTTIDGIANQFEVRYTPAVNVVKAMSFNELLVGKGLGYLFEIPWFEYRGLDTDAISMDSFWLTMYVKNGILSVFWIIAFVAIINHGKAPWFGYLYSLVFIVLGLTMSLLYQQVFVGLFVMGILTSEMVRQKVILSSYPKTVTHVAG